MDGEEVTPYGPVRVEVHRGLIKVLCDGYQMNSQLPASLFYSK